MKDSMHRVISTILIVLAAMLLAGCSGADEPKIAATPDFAPPPKVEPPKLQGRKEQYGQNPKYKQMMEKMERNNQ
jgi:hypothetical protein